MSRIAGSTALVTGGASGIGRLTGTRLLEAGAERLVVWDVEAIRGDRIFLRLPAPGNLLPLVRGLLPTRWFDRVVGERGGVYDTMRTFRGRR